MEYLAKILYEEKDGDFWKYKVLNLETGERDWVHNHEKLDYFPSLPGKIKLFPNEDNQEKKFCQLFDQDIFETKEEFQKVEDLEKSFNLWEELEKDVSQSDNIFAKRKFKLTPQEIKRLRKEGVTQKQIARSFQVSERTVRNREKEDVNKPKQKRGRKPKISGYNLALLKSFVNPKDKRNKIVKTQQEAVEEYRKKGLEISQSAISRTLTKEEQSYKKGEKQYAELNVEKAKQFVLDNYWLYSYSNCFSLDEFGFYANEIPYFVCSRKGSRAKIVQLGEKGTHFTVILCVQNLAGEGEVKVSHKLIKNVRKKGKKKKNKDKEKEKRGTTAVDLHDLIARINFTDNSYILLDNAKIHHAVKSLIKAKRLPIKELAVKKGIVLVYLPSHAPMIQPAEFFINEVKDFIKSKLKDFIGRKQLPTDEEIENIIEEAMKDLEKKDLTKHFLHCRDKLNVKPNYKSRK